jgi:two-component system nitrate/nitrite response regulator NarL
VPTRVCLVGRRQLFRAGLRHILGGELFEVALEIDDLAFVRECPPDCRLFVIDKPDDIRDIEDDLRWLRSSISGVRIVVLADSMEADQMAVSFAAGVDGYLLADISPVALCESLRLVEVGEKVFPSRMVTLLSSASWSGARQAARVAYADDRSLSEREVEIVSRLAGGLPNKVIAHELTITEATVKVHLKNILKKLGVANRTQAAIWAVHHGVAAVSI